MKVFIATITSNYDGNVEVSVKPFSTFEKAVKYLHKEYLDIKSESEEDDDLEQDYLSNEDFYMESADGLYWCSGYIYGMDME